MNDLDRRTFLAASAATVAISAAGRAAANSANNKVVLAVMGLHNRGPQLINSFNKLPNIEIAYVADPDERQLEKGVKASTQSGKRTAAKAIRDFREALDDPAVDALVCAAPNHWHAAATIAACEAGKHVYVEKPCSHTAEEGEMMIAAGQRNDRVIQVGMQRRSGPLYQQMVEKVRGGAIGEVLLGKSFFYRNRPSVGHATDASPPGWLDFDMWQGPVTERPYRENILHYNWHHFWHWGDGEIGNNGVHTIDICRWALGVDFPDGVEVSASKLRYDDDQETPDTMTANFRCGEKLISWEGVSWSDPYQTGNQIGIELRGTDGTLFINDQGYTIYDIERKVVQQQKAGRGDIEHLQNFVDCIHSGSRPNGNIDEGHRSAMFCHLANIAHRTDQSLRVDPTNGHLIDGGKAADLWGVEYRDKWMPRV